MNSWRIVRNDTIPAKTNGFMGITENLLANRRDEAGWTLKNYPQLLEEIIQRLKERGKLTDKLEKEWEKYISLNHVSKLLQT